MLCKRPQTIEDELQGQASPAVLPNRGGAMLPFTPEPTLCELCLIREFSDVRLVLLRRVCGLLFFLYSLQAFDLLEGEAHDAAVLALVLEVDGLLVVVDEDLRGHPAAVVKPLCPLRDVFVLYLLGLLAHPRLLLPSLMSLYPEEAPYISQEEALRGDREMATWYSGLWSPGRGGALLAAVGL